MKTKFFTLLLALAASVGTLLASNTIGGISYNLYKSTLTAEVTYNGSSYIKNTYSGAINIPSTVYHSENGKLYTYTVTSIGDNAFRSSTGLTSVTIPNSVTTIGSNAFLDCSKLTSINVNTNNAYYISNNGVLFNKAMTLLKQYPAGKTGNYTIPSSVSIIEERAFTGCRNLTSVTIGNSVTSIGNSAFSGCSGLQSIKIPNSLTKIGDKVFIGCSGLISITIGNSVTSIGDSAFSGCSGLTSISIPNCVTSIGLYAFHYCSGLTSVNIGNGVTTIAISAFSDCTNLTSVTIGSNVTYIGLDAFYKCNNLTSVTLNSNSLVSKSYTSNSNISTIFGNNVTEYNIGDGIANIGSNAFSGCSAMNSITIPNSVTNIGEGAFSNCSGLTSVTIPNSVTSIGEGAFFGCTGLTSLTIGNSVTSIGKEAFYDCSGLTSIEIPNSVTSIGDDAFYNCSGLTSVTIGNSVTSIGDDAFYNCSGLTSIEIPNSVTSIGEYAFWGCSGLTSIDVAADNINYCSVEGVLFNKDQTSLIKYPGGKQGAYIIPNSVTSIRSDAFSGCTSLTSVTIPNSVTSIGNNAFYNCTGLTSVTIPNSVTSIGNNVFSGCNSLTSVTIPNSVTSIGEWAFYGCTGLTSIEIPNSVTSIGMEAFSGCISLTSVAIGNSITKIGEYAFYGCSSLASMVIEAETPPTLDGSWGNWFDSRYLTSIYVPCGTTEAYRTAAGWSNYASKIKEQSLPYTITTNALNGSISIDSICYDITLTVTPDEGYRFTQWSDGNKDNPRTFVLTQDTTFTAEFSNQFSINITCNEEYGTIVGENGMFDYLSEHTYEAVPNSGYHFTQWSDGNKDNPRTITLTQDTSLTAEFSNLYSIHVSCNEEQGSINGENGMFDYLSEHTYEAVPNSGYYFVKWSDGNKDNPRTIVLTQDTSLTAIFDILYNVSVQSDDPTMGSASFSDLLETQSLNYGQYPIGTNLIAKAIPNQGYKFSHWSDGLSANPRGITVQSDINLKAYFELEQNSYTVTVLSANSLMGTVSGGGTYEEGQTATVTATPKSGYKFTRWSNGSTANPYSFTVTSDVSLTAYFEQSSTPQPESSTFWNMSDAAFNSLGTISSNKTINGLTIYATSSKNVVIDGSNQEIDGLSFTHRLKLNGTGSSDARLLSFHVDGKCDIDVYLKSGSGSEDRTINVDKGSFGSSLTTIPALSTSISKGTIHYTGGATTIYLYSPSSGVNIYAIRVTSETTPQPTTYTVTVSSANTSMGTVSGGGQYEEGATATITATPKSGYKFTRWSDGSTANPYSFTVTGNVSLTAYFEQSSTPEPASSKFWNISDGAFNSLGTITSTKTIDGLTIYATSSKNVVIDGSNQEIDGLSFTHRLKLNGTGSSDARLLSFHVDGKCDIDVYLKSGSGTEDRTLNIDEGSFGSSLTTIPALSASISKGTIHYTGGATTIYLYSPSSGVNVYAIRVTTGGGSEDVENTYYQEERAQKILRNGQILIIRGDHTYTLQGQEVK